jgi:PIN domain nuclease of toxin-antitoxin system
MKILLDSCSFLWITGDSARLSKKAVEAFRNPSNDVFLSAVSIWEISLKYALGQIEFPSPLPDFIPRVRQEYGIHFIPLEETVALRLPDLPMIHKDPFDRMLICQAKADGMTILTPDVHIRKYDVKTLW